MDSCADSADPPRSIQSACDGRQLSGQVFCAARTTSSLRRTRSCWLAATTAGLYRRYSCAALTSHREPMGQWSARVARTRRWASHSCRGRSRQLLRHPRHTCARPPCAATRARALSARMLACHIRLCLGRLWDHSKQSPMSLFHPVANCETDRPCL